MRLNCDCIEYLLNLMARAAATRVASPSPRFFTVQCKKALLSLGYGLMIEGHRVRLENACTITRFISCARTCACA